MTSQPTSIENDASAGDAALRFLHRCARLLVEYNTDSKGIERSLARVARRAGVVTQTVVGYREVALVTSDGRSFHAQAPELRINVAVSAGTRRVIDEYCQDRIGLADATQTLEALEQLAPRHGRWLVVVLFGLAASAIAWLLRADWSTIGVSGASAAAALVSRQEVARRTGVLVVPPFAAGLAGAVVSSAAIRLGWTATEGLCLIVPALMFVPGPHLINSLHDLIENQMQTAVCRLALAVAILTATALGVVLGAWLLLGPSSLPTAPSEGIRLTLALDMALAGVAACGFAAFYNAPWRVLWVSVLCGMVGHGLRFVSLGYAGVAISTLFACLAIGVMAGFAARRLHLPFSAIAFAGAVPMMPGVFIYQSIAGAMRLSAAGTMADPALAATTLALASKSVFVVGAMVAGLLGGALLTNAGSRSR